MGLAFARLRAWFQSFFAMSVPAFQPWCPSSRPFRCMGVFVVTGLGIARDSRYNVGHVAVSPNLCFSLGVRQSAAQKVFAQRCCPKGWLMPCASCQLAVVQCPVRACTAAVPRGTHVARVIVRSRCSNSRSSAASTTHDWQLAALAPTPKLGAVAGLICAWFGHLFQGWMACQVPR